MPAYRTFNGPCHWDLKLCFYVFLGPRYARHNIGNVNTHDGRRQVAVHTRRLMRRLQDQFDEFFNPNKEDGEWVLYEFGACCSFHIDIRFRLPPDDWWGLRASQIEDRLPEGCGILIVDRIGMTEHPHASISGRRVLLDQNNDKYVLAHELGHILGLPDQYRTSDVSELGVKGNGMTREEEDRHRGHLMGKKDRRGRREIVAHEIQEIARLTGMTCDRSECCPAEDETDSGEEGAEKSVPRSEKKAVKMDTENIELAIGPHAGVVTSFDLALDSLGKRQLNEFLAELNEGRKGGADDGQDNTVAGMNAAEHALGESIDRMLQADVEFVPECETEYRLHVYHRVLVDDCNNISDEEREEMSRGLVRKGRSAAKAICELNEECPTPVLLRYRFARIECAARLWEVDLIWIFHCVAN